MELLSAPSPRRVFAQAALAASLLAAGAILISCGSDPTDPPPVTDDCDLAVVVEDAGVAGAIYTYAGTGANGWLGEDRPRLDARFSQPADIMFASTGDAYVLDWNNHMVRRIDTAGRMNTAIGFPPSSGGSAGLPGDGPQPYFPDEDDRIAPVNALHCALNHPTEMTELPDGRFVLTAWHNHKLRVYDPVAGTEQIIVGSLARYGGDGLAHHDSEVFLKQPSQSELGPDGHLYILDQQNQRIRRIRDYMTDPNGIIETVAGTGEFGFNGDNLGLLETEFSFEFSTNPQISGGMVIADDGIIYIADTGNYIVRKLDLVANKVTILAGTPGVSGGEGDGVLGTSATFAWPLDVELGPDGRLYIADEYNHAVRALDLGTGMLTTVAGQLAVTTPLDCQFPTSEQIGDGLAATDAFLFRPRGLGFDAAGRLYIADTFHYRIRVMTLEDSP